ncbi:acyl-[acyl-carrier-protein] thioesterase [Myroides sp. LJL116]
MPICANFESIYIENFTVDYFDCQPNGQIKLVDLCRLMQIASSNHAVSGGISYWDLQKSKQAWVLNKFRLEIKDLPHWQEQICIHTWIERLEGFRSIRNFAVYAQDKLIASASSLWVIINTVTRRPEVMQLGHEHFEKFPDKKAIEGQFTRFNKQQDLQSLQKDTVKYSDLDMLDHVTNTKYLEWIINALHQNDMALNTTKVVDMIFHKELLFKEPYSIDRNTFDHPNHYLIQDSQNNVNFQCIIE